MSLLFPNRVSLTRDPLGFLLREADHAPAPLAPLALGFHRVHLVNDLSLIKNGPFDSGSPSLADPPSAVFEPITIRESYKKDRITQNKEPDIPPDSANFIGSIAPDLLINIRRTIFSAYRHASFDCWHFSTSLATKLTFAMLFGFIPKHLIDQRAFTRYAELIHSSRDLIALDIICKREQERLKREQSCNQSLQNFSSKIRTAFEHRQAQSICGHFYKTESEDFIPLEEICRLTLAVRQATAEAFFWTIFAVARSKILREIIEEEADACLLSNGDLDLDKLHLAKSTRSMSWEILRLAPINNILVYFFSTGQNLEAHGARNGDRIVICPHAFFRSERHFPEADTLIIGRDYPADLLKLQYLACGGGLVFRISLLNLALLFLDLAAAFEFELVEGPPEFLVLPSFQAARPDVKVRLNLRRSSLFR